MAPRSNLHVSIFAVISIFTISCGTANTVVSESEPLRTPAFQLGIRSAEGIFLGCWNCDASDAQSVLNEYGAFGSPYSPTSLNNSYGAGSPYAPNGACNPYAVAAPVLFLSIGNAPSFPGGFGTLSVSTSMQNGVCNPSARSYSSAECSKLKTICAP